MHWLARDQGCAGGCQAEWETIGIGPLTMAFGGWLDLAAPHVDKSIGDLSSVYVPGAGSHAA